MKNVTQPLVLAKNVCVYTKNEHFCKVLANAVFVVSEGTKEDAND